jgi:hypothetical protein
MDISTTAPMVAETIDRITIMDDAKAVTACLARRTRLMREEFGDIMRQILKTAPHDKAASETPATATIRYRQVRLCRSSFSASRSERCLAMSKAWSRSATPDA